MGKSTISMAIFNSYVSLPEGISSYLSEYVCHFCRRNSGPLSDLNGERESCCSPNINVFVRGSPANAYSFATWNAVYIDCFV